MCGDAHAAREKLARQYAALFPALSEHYPDVFPARLYTCVCVSLQSRLCVCPYSSCEGTCYRMP